MRTILIVIVFISITFILGCSRQNLAPVSGIVIYEGQPLPDADICFLPEEAKNHTVSVRTGINGRFTLTTFKKNDGVTPGRYKVIVSKLEEQGSKNFRPLIPTHYNLPNKSGLTVDVPTKGIKDLKFELTSK